MLQTKTEPIKFTVSDIEALAFQNDEKKYEIIDGELFVARSPHINHLFYQDFLARFNNFLAK